MCKQKLSETCGSTKSVFRFLSVKIDEKVDPMQAIEAYKRKLEAHAKREKERAERDAEKHAERAERSWWTRWFQRSRWWF